MFSKQKVGNAFAVLLAEFLGTGVLTYVFLRMLYVNQGGTTELFLAIASGLALATGTFMFAAKSGAHLNPAVTIGLWTARQVKTLPAAAYVVVQLFGAWVAYELFTYLFTSSATDKIPAYYEHLNFFDVKIFAAEATGALVFSLAWAAALHRAKSTNAFAGYVGVAYAVALLVASVATLGLVNPALALGVRFWHIWSAAAWGSFVFGPLAGAIVGFNLYEYFFKDNAEGVKVLTSLATNGTTKPAASKSTAKKKPAARKKR